MKSLIFTLLALLGITSCNAQSTEQKNKDNMAQKGKALVVFFSHAGDNYAVGNIEVGNTKILAIRSVWRRISTSSTSR